MVGRDRQSTAGTVLQHSVGLCHDVKYEVYSGTGSRGERSEEQCGKCLVTVCWIQIPKVLYVADSTLLIFLHS